MSEKFKESIEYKDIKKELSIIKVLDKVAKFNSYCDRVFTYEYVEDDVTLEFNIICEDVLLAELLVEELLELKSILYFEHNIYMESEKIASKTFKQ